MLFAKNRAASERLEEQIAGVRLEGGRIRVEFNETRRRDHAREVAATACFVLGLILSVGANIAGAP